jgi:regulator of sirC expression with transglutaminase-like and TPR domain
VSDRLETSARARLAPLLRREPVPLDAAALAIAAEEYPALDPGVYLARLDALAERVAARAGAPLRAAAALRALRDVLHGEAGLRGNTADYYDPRNSYLSDVLDRGLGIPITLCVVYMEVGRRLGLALEGVALPGHFMARLARGAGPQVYLDAFSGELLSAEECLARHRERTGAATPGPEALPGATPQQILARLLGNLRRTYRERRDDVRLYAVLDQLLLVAPGQLDALRDRGLCAARLGAAGAARRDLEGYLAQAPDRGDAEDVNAALQGLDGAPPLN